MNLKFFILGLYVFVSIAQVKAQPNGIENAEMNGKPDQFRLMEFFSHPKRNILSDLFELKTDEGKALDRSKRQKPTSSPVPAVAAATTMRTEEMNAGRRFNPMEAISNFAKKPMQLAMKQAISKVMASYSDSSKPFGPTYDTTYGSPGSPGAPQSGFPAFNRKMNSEDHQQPDEEQMSTMIQPPPGQTGYYSYQVQKRPAYYGTPNYGQTYRSFGHSLEPSLPYQANYDQHINGKQTAFEGPPPGYFPYNPHEQQAPENKPFYQQGRRANTNINNVIKNIMVKTPEEINKILSELQKNNKPKGADEISTRNGFVQDVYDKGSEERSSGEEYSKTQVEFTGPQADVVIGNRRFAGNEDSHSDVQDDIEKLVESTFKGLVVTFSYMQGILETGTPEQIGERFVSLYEVLKHVKSYFESIV